MSNEFRLPSLTQRTAICGRTGSGKTRFATWVLSRSRFDVQPYVVVDYKLDDLIGQSSRIREIGFKDIPKHPGVYVIRPGIGSDEQMEEWLWKIWQREKIGLYIDEGYMLPQKSGGAYSAILTQGRSKRIPVIALSQRPKWLLRFVFSEADFIACFQLSHTEDYKTVQEYIRKDAIDLANELPDYHSYWYDVSRRTGFKMLPVPNDDEIIGFLDSRLSPKRKEL